MSMYISRSYGKGLAIEARMPARTLPFMHDIETLGQMRYNLAIGGIGLSRQSQAPPDRSDPPAPPKPRFSAPLLDFPRAFVVVLIYVSSIRIRII